MNEDELAFDKFWQASALNRFNIQDFAQQLNAFDSDAKSLQLEYPHDPYILPKRNTKLQKMAKNRTSVRKFSDTQLNVKELGEIFGCFQAINGLEHRGYPSAGATYVTEIYGAAFSVENFKGKILYYDAERHGVVTVSNSCPSWQTALPSLNISIEGTPCLLVIFVMFPKRSTAKYGERGGRFALLEVGAAMQQLSLTLAQSKRLKGVIVGGMLDEYWKQLLDLSGSDAHIALGYLVGA